MSYLRREDPADYQAFFRSQHSIWTTPPEQLAEILQRWNMPGAFIGPRISAGESTEVYPVYDTPGLDLLGYLRIAHGGLINEAEIIFMNACAEAGLPTVKLMHAVKKQVSNGKEPIDVGVTFLAPAVGTNLLELIENVPTDPIHVDAINAAVRNAGVLLAQMHALTGSSELVKKAIAQHEDGIFIEALDAGIEKIRGLMKDIPDAKLDLMRISAAYPEVRKGLVDLRKKSQLVVAHSDVDPKHLFIDPATGEITSLIDFGGARVDLPHHDFVHWKTYSASTYGAFLDSYLEERFGTECKLAEAFKADIDFSFAISHLSMACIRMDQLLIPEAVGHLARCAAASDRIASRSAAHSDILSY